MHWADVEAKKVIERDAPYRIATGITPSGHIHVGNMREILTGDTVYRALVDKGHDAVLYYIADSFDPLRKVYSFLDDSYSAYVGQPISEIPCPCGNHDSYADHFLEPFLRAVSDLGIHPEVKYVHRMYGDGQYYDATRKVIEEKDNVREIIGRITGRELPDHWFPYTPKCAACNTFANTRVTDYSDPHVSYECACGARGKADIRTDDGKLPWRIEWPARWYHLSINCEPFGKDHAAAGGSYETGKEIMEKVLGGDAPHPVIYEWIQLKGKGAMSSSKGVVVSAVDMLKMTPPEVLRFLVMRVDPPRHIDFDPGFGILNLVDEYDRYEELYFGAREEGTDAENRKRIFELSQVDPARPMSEGYVRQVPYRHMVSLVQIDPGSDEVIARLKRTEKLEDLSEREFARIDKRLRCARFWVENYAPDAVRFSLQSRFQPSMIEGMDEVDRRIISELLCELDDVSWAADELHAACYNVKERLGISPKKVFRSLYQLLLDQPRGPRLGYFLSTLSRDFVRERLEEALTALRV